MRRRLTSRDNSSGLVENKPRQDELPGRSEKPGSLRSHAHAWRRQQKWRAAIREHDGPRRGLMASDRSKRTYIIGWDVCGSLPLQLKEMDAGLRAKTDRHLKTNHR